MRGKSLQENETVREKSSNERTHTPALESANGWQSGVGRDFQENANPFAGWRNFSLLLAISRQRTKGRKAATERPK